MGKSRVGRKRRKKKKRHKRLLFNHVLKRVKLWQRNARVIRKHWSVRDVWQNYVQQNVRKERVVVLEMIQKHGR